VALLAFCVAAVGVALVVPRAPAIACLLGFQAAVGADLDVESPAPAGFRLLADEARYGVARAWHLAGKGRRAPAILFVHGVAPEGIRDGRILHAARAFHAAGFTVVVPELPTLVNPLLEGEASLAVAGVLRAMTGGAIEGVHPERIGIVGISVGGGLALRGCAHFRAAGGVGIRALLLIGAPYDMRRTSVGWFEAEDHAEASDGSYTWEVRNAASFARNFLIRAGLRTRLGDDPDLELLAAWMASEPLPTEPLVGVNSPAALAIAKLLHAEPAVRAAARERVLADATQRIESLSPALWLDDLVHLRGTAVFLLHGHGDPLVPITEAPLLAERLRKHTVVSVLESHMVGHTSVNDATLGEKLAHVVQMDDFFRMIGR